MSYKKQPSPGKGFIYILSNPSMVNVYKVGLTTSSVKQRIQELSTTGVPRPFQAERVFEIPETKLRAVEQLAHKKLKNKDLHHGKEFFEGSLHDCVTAVEDAIYEITKSGSVDLVGQARERADAELRRREEEQRLGELEKQRRIILEQRVTDANRGIDSERANYINTLIIEENNKKPFLEKYIWEPFGYFLVVTIGFYIMSVGGPLAWLGVPLLFWWIISKDKSNLRERRMKSASEKYPYFTVDTINSYYKKDSTCTTDNTTKSANIKNDNTKPIEKNRPRSNLNPPSPQAKEWVILNKKIYNKRTHHLFKFGKLNPKADWIHVYPNPNWSDPIKLALDDVDNVEYLGSNAIVRCPQCNQRCSMPKKHTLVVECPKCKQSWTQQLIED
jgi:hypothetical protein